MNKTGQAKMPVSFFSLYRIRTETLFLIFFVFYRDIMSKELYKNR